MAQVQRKRIDLKKKIQKKKELLRNKLANKERQDDTENTQVNKQGGAVAPDGKLPFEIHW